MVCAVEAMGLPMSLLILVCACFVLDGGAEFRGAERREGVWHGGEEGVGVLSGAALKYHRLRRLIVECSCGRENIEAARPCTYFPSINFLGRARGF